jgi:hypothetical protein
MTRAIVKAYMEAGADSARAERGAARLLEYVDELERMVPSFAIGAPGSGATRSAADVERDLGTIAASLRSMADAWRRVPDDVRGQVAEHFRLVARGTGLFEQLEHVMQTAGDIEHGITTFAGGVYSTARGTVERMLVQYVMDALLHCSPSGISLRTARSGSPLSRVLDALWPRVVSIVAPVPAISREAAVAAAREQILGLPTLSGDGVPCRIVYTARRGAEPRLDLVPLRLPRPDA